METTYGLHADRACPEYASVLVFAFPSELIALQGGSTALGMLRLRLSETAQERSESDSNPFAV